MRSLIITLAIYAIPVLTTGAWWFLQLAFSSILYIALIYHLSKYRERSLLIGVEFINLACITTTFYNFYISMSQSFVSAHIADIINVCFLTELLIILGGAALGVYKRHSALGGNASFSDTLRRWFNLSVEVNV